MRIIARSLNIFSILSVALLLSGTARIAFSAQNHSSLSNRSAPIRKGNFFVYIGTYTHSAPNGHPDGTPLSKGIYVARFNAATGEFSEPQLAAEVADPSFLVVSPDHRYLYATTETAPESFVSSYAIDRATGKLRLLNKLPTGGAGTAFVSMDKAGKFVMMANYGSRSVSVIRVKADGSLGELTSFMQHSPVARESNTVPHPHAVVTSDDNRFAIVPDLGLEKIFIYGFDATAGTLSTFPPASITMAPGNGPRHFTFSPNGKFGYLLSQNTGNIDVFKWDSAVGSLTSQQTIPTLPQGLEAQNMSAEIAITPDGRFLYESNRRTHGTPHELGPDTIGAYKINPSDGTLSEIQQVDPGGSIPRYFGIDPTGAYLLSAVQQSNRIVAFKIDTQTGQLTNTGKSITVHTPSCMQFVPAIR